MWRLKLVGILARPSVKGDIDEVVASGRHYGLALMIRRGQEIAARLSHALLKAPLLLFEHLPGQGAHIPLVRFSLAPEIRPFLRPLVRCIRAQHLGLYGPDEIADNGS